MTYKELVDFHISSNFWKSENDQRYGYILSPEPFSLSDDIQKQLVQIGKAVAIYQNGSHKLYELVNTYKNRASEHIKNIFKQGCDGLPMLSSNRNTPLCKVDLIIDTNNCLKIVEIDAYNPRAIPYASFFKEIYSNWNKAFFQGVESIIEKELIKRDTTDLVWYYADKERYYENGFKQLQRIMREVYKINIQLINAFAYKEEPKPDAAILMIPLALHKPEEIITKQKLLTEYIINPNKFLYPLTPWMGCKAIMALISNSSRNPNVESMIIQSYEDIEFLRNFLPASTIVNRFNKDYVLTLSQNKHWILKKSFSSGHKDVHFNYSKDFQHIYESALQAKRSSYILQEEIKQKQFKLNYYGENGILLRDSWFIRLTIHVNHLGEVIEAEVTARKEPCVYGALDSIQIPCVRQ